MPSLAIFPSSNQAISGEWSTAAGALGMMDKLGLEHLDDLARHILDHPRAASLAIIARLKPGTYRNEMTTATASTASR